MIKVGLTGNRYTGKDIVGRIFEQINVPVFNVDVIIKFILQYKNDIDSDIKIQLGRGVFTNDGFLDPRKFNTTEKFNRLLEIVEPDLFMAYQKFIVKNKKSLYTIFHSSILFENGWDKKMDQNISVFSPKDVRIARCKRQNHTMSLQNIYDFMSTEYDDLTINRKSNYVIHNYDDALSLTAQVDDIDRKLVDLYLKDKMGNNFTNSTIVKNIMS